MAIIELYFISDNTNILPSYSKLIDHYIYKTYQISSALGDASVDCRNAMMFLIKKDHNLIIGQYECGYIFTSTEGPDFQFYIFNAFLDLYGISITGLQYSNQTK